MEDPWTNDWDLFAVRKIDTVCRHHSRRTLYPQRVREKFKARFAKENDLAPSNIPERRMKTSTNAVRVDCTVNRAFVTGRIQSEILYRVSRFPLSHSLPSFVLRQLPRKFIVRFSKSGSRIFRASFKIGAWLSNYFIALRTLRRRRTGFRVGCRNFILQSGRRERRTRCSISRYFGSWDISNKL